MYSVCGIQFYANMSTPSDKTQDHLQNGAHPTVGGDEAPTEMAVKPPKAAGKYIFESNINIHVDHSSF